MYIIINSRTGLRAKQNTTSRFNIYINKRISLLNWYYYPCIWILFNPCFVHSKNVYSSVCNYRIGQLPAKVWWICCLFYCLSGVSMLQNTTGRFNIYINKRISLLNWYYYPCIWILKNIWKFRVNNYMYSCSVLE
jgi:hypothetical protein